MPPGKYKTQWRGNSCGNTTESKLGCRSTGWVRSFWQRGGGAEEGPNQGVQHVTKGDATLDDEGSRPKGRHRGMVRPSNIGSVSGGRLRPTPEFQFIIFSFDLFGAQGKGGEPLAALKGQIEPKWQRGYER